MGSSSRASRGAKSGGGSGSGRGSAETVVFEVLVVPIGNFESPAHSCVYDVDDAQAGGWLRMQCAVNPRASWPFLSEKYRRAGTQEPYAPMPDIIKPYVDWAREVRSVNKEVRTSPRDFLQAQPQHQQDDRLRSVCMAFPDRPTMYDGRYKKKVALAQDVTINGTVYRKGWSICKCKFEHETQHTAREAAADLQGGMQEEEDEQPARGTADHADADDVPPMQLSQRPARAAGAAAAAKLESGGANKKRRATSAAAPSDEHQAAAAALQQQVQQLQAAAAADGAAREAEAAALRQQVAALQADNEALRAGLNPGGASPAVQRYKDALQRQALVEKGLRARVGELEGQLQDKDDQLAKAKAVADTKLKALTANMQAKLKAVQAKLDVCVHQDNLYAEVVSSLVQACLSAAPGGSATKFQAAVRMLQYLHGGGHATGQLAAEALALLQQQPLPGASHVSTELTKWVHGQGQAAAGSAEREAAVRCAEKVLDVLKQKLPAVLQAEEQARQRPKSSR